MPTAERGSRRIHFESTGEGPAVILVPGLGAGSKLFGTLPRRFERAGFRCISFDPVGVPPSSAHQGAYDLEEAGRDLLAVAENAGLDRFDLLGTSLGGKVALVTANLAPERIRRLVLLASSVVSTPRSRRIYRFFEILANRLQPAELAEAMAAFLFGRSFQQKRPRVVADLVGSMHLDAAARALMIAQTRCLQAFDGATIAAKVTCPTLCLAGGEDTLTGPDEIRASAEQIPNARFELVPKAGHSLLLEAAEVLSTTLDFLQAD
ncbi:MAG: alpha/beta hydrolase [Planctomycetota bacterium]|nr:alpha/beta hydrolase [Planctomycetota bacterium]